MPRVVLPSLHVLPNQASFPFCWLKIESKTSIEARIGYWNIDSGGLACPEGGTKAVLSDSCFLYLGVWEVVSSLISSQHCNSSCLSQAGISCNRIMHFVYTNLASIAL